MIDLSEFKDKRVLVTGHTGFKGTWLCFLLKKMGAEVYGYALEPEETSLFNILNMDNEITSIIGDIRDYQKLLKVFEDIKPEFVFHLAAQPLVRESYNDPLYTYETNVMGTVNLLECIRLNKNYVKSVINVTTDKVYANKEDENIAYREDELLDGHDPYSNSKSCSELVTHSYKKSFFNDSNVRVSTARAGNVIGGGDFAKDRIIPDCIRAVLNNENIIVRNPYSIRPYQHVLEALFAYLMIAAYQYNDKSYAGYYNVGPDDNNCIKTGDLVNMFCNLWGNNAKWINKCDFGPHEATFLKLDCSKLKSTFNWNSCWDINKSIIKTIEWTKCFERGEDPKKCMNKQIEEYITCFNCEI